jgi:hypothetical protein
MSLFLCSNCCCGYPYPESALVELEVLAGDDVYFAYEIGTYYPDGVKQNTLQKFAVVSVLYTAPQITGVYQLVPLQDIQNPSTRAVYGRALGFVSGENNLSLSLSTNSQGSGIVGAFPDNTVFRFFLGMDPLVRSVITYGANAEPVSLEQLKSRQFTQNFPFSGQNQSQPYNYPFTIFDESLIEGFVPRGNTRHQPFTQVLEECISSQSTLSRKILFQVGVGFTSGLAFDKRESLPSVAFPVLVNDNTDRSDMQPFGIPEDTGTPSSDIPFSAADFRKRPLIGSLSDPQTYEYKFLIKSISLFLKDDVLEPVPRP